MTIGGGLAGLILLIGLKVGITDSHDQVTGADTAAEVEDSAAVLWRRPNPG